MGHYEVLIADSHYRSDRPLTYSSDQTLNRLDLVSVPVKDRVVSGFVLKKVSKPKFPTKSIKTVSGLTLPEHCLKLAGWLASYYHCSLGEAMRQFAPSGAAARRVAGPAAKETADDLSLSLSSKLTTDQQNALKKIKNHKIGTILLHGDTGSGKTRVYLELAAQTLKINRSVIILTPEIALTSQLAQATKRFLNSPVFILHSQLPVAQRKTIWKQIASSTEPVVVIGPRSALFSPVNNPGLIVVDEAHEPAYKQDQSPRYHASRVASQLGNLTGAKVILGTATPSLVDYFLAKSHGAVVRMQQLAVRPSAKPAATQLVDLKNPANFSSYPYLSKQFIKSAKDTLASGHQVMVYLNRRGSARLLLCVNCGWRMLCPNCDIPLVYHGDEHKSRCHTCGYASVPPANCPQCGAPDIIYKSAGTKTLADSLKRAFPNYRLQRFDSDSSAGETVHELYTELRSGQIDIIVGTQLLAKGLDLPKLGLVGVATADSSLNMPDFTASERTFQLLYQVAGRVGRGHIAGSVIIQTYDPNNPAINAALNRDWQIFYDSTLSERQNYNYPPFVYLLKLECKRSSSQGAQKAATELKKQLLTSKLPVQVFGPTPSFRNKRGASYYWQLVVKSKQRAHLLQLAGLAGSGWSIDLDPLDLL